MKKAAVKRGFTLVEMLVVIAIVAVLIALVLPTAEKTVKKSRAATDAANLRNLLSKANILFLEHSGDEVIEQLSADAPECETYPGAKAYVINNFPAFVDVYFVDGEKYYSLDYFRDVVATGSSSRSTAMPTGEPYDGNWYPLYK